MRFQRNQTATQRFLAKIKIDGGSGCWEWTATRVPQGYGQFWDGKKMRRAHRFSYELHCGRIPDGLHVLHRCDNPPCVNPYHLFLGSNDQNIADRNTKGRQVILRGTKHGCSKLSDQDVLAIRAAKNVTQTSLAKQYGVSQAQVWRIQHGLGWEHLPESA